jgi:hypothetical protein
MHLGLVAVLLCTAFAELFLTGRTGFKKGLTGFFFVATNPVNPAQFLLILSKSVTSC